MPTRQLLATAATAFVAAAFCGCRCNLDVPAPGRGSPRLEVSRQPVSSAPQPPQPPPSSSMPQPAAAQAPAPAPGPPPRSTSRTRPATAPEGEPRDLPGPPLELFSRWNLAGALPAFQGAWLTPGVFLGSWEAWEVQGDRVSIYNGRSVSVRQLEIESPCTVKVVLRRGGGFRSSTSVFVAAEGELWKGLGAGGYRRGKAALFCSHGRIYSTDGQRCVAYRSSSGSRPWQAFDTRCGFDRGDDGSEVFFFQHLDSEIPARVYGDVLASWQLKATHSIRQPSFDVAKVARDARQR